MLYVSMVCFCIDALRLNGLFLCSCYTSKWLVFVLMLYVSMVCFCADAIRLNGVFVLMLTSRSTYQAHRDVSCVASVPGKYK